VRYGVLWQLQVPNANKNFMWRACHNILPTRDNLMRKIITDSRCPICGIEVERLYIFCGLVLWLLMYGVLEKGFSRKSIILVLISYNYWSIYMRRVGKKCSLCLLDRQRVIG
jgi:hypothetical protein